MLFYIQTNSILNDFSLTLCFASWIMFSMFFFVQYEIIQFISSQIPPIFFIVGYPTHVRIIHINHIASFTRICRDKKHNFRLA